jgi:multidrug resistance efflux pump
MRRALSEPWSVDSQHGADVALAEVPVLRARAAEKAESEARGYLASGGAGRVLSLLPAAWVGRHVAAGDSLFDVGRADSLEVLLVASERDAGDLGLGRRADLRLYADPGRRIACAVRSIDGAPLEGAALPAQTAALVDAERAARRFVARARIANPGDRLRPGMSGFARVDAVPLNLLQRAARFYARLVRADFWL